MKIEELRELREFLVKNSISFDEISSCLGDSCFEPFQNYLKENNVSLSDIQKELESVDWELEDMRDLMFNKLEEVREAKRLISVIKLLGKGSLALGVLGYAMCVSLASKNYETVSVFEGSLGGFAYGCIGFVPITLLAGAAGYSIRELEYKKSEFQKLKDQHHDLRESRRPKLSE